MKKLLLTFFATSALLLGFNHQASAGGWSFGVAVNNGGYYQPRNDYYRPSPAYCEPVYYAAPRPVYYRPAPVYYPAPRRVYAPYYSNRVRYYGGNGYCR